MRKLGMILLVDDDEACNYFHYRLLKKMDCAENIHIAKDGLEALSYLQAAAKGEARKPDLIFLDLNMPRMNGWTFLEKYENLSEEERAGIIVVMVSTSLNPDDYKRAINNRYVSEFAEKYLDEQNVIRIISTYFPSGN